MKPSFWGVALTYVGAVIGAGFASGQEIYQFFGRFGTSGIVGIAVAGLLFGALGYLALERGRKEQVRSFGALLGSLYPQGVVRAAEGVTTAFLVVGLGVVSAGGGAAVGRLIHIPLLVGGAFTTGAILLVAMRGTASVVRANSLLVPYLILLVVLVAVMSWSHPIQRPVSYAPGWLLAAFLYLSYNIFTGIMVLLGLGRELASRRQSLMAAALGALILSVLAYLEHHVLGTIAHVGALPMVDIAAHLHAVWGILFGISLWIALFTTGVAEAYALREQYGSRILWLAAATFLFGLLGFEKLVALLYPLMGVVAVMLWVPLIYRRNRGVPGG